MHELLIISKRELDILVKDFAVLWGAIPIPEIIGHKGIPGLCF